MAVKSFRELACKDMADAVTLTTCAREVYVARAGRALGAIRSADVLRREAKAAVAAIQKMGLKVVLRSGDTQGAPQRWVRPSAWIK
jgi:cation transport ATPase